ncbi:MAG TPA: nucleotidyltransferase family protein [Aliidiomarina sp.]|nr:nucleotidyltransferase family protein [Aliidiomarina sp.]
MKAMILAAGRGERMRPLTDTLPKPLLVVGGKPLIYWHLEKLANAGVTEVIINTAWLAAELVAAIGNGEQWGIRVQWSHEPSGGLETAGGIIQALPLLGEAPFWLVNGDVWTDFNFDLLPKPNCFDDSLGHLVLVDNPAHHPTGDFALSDENKVSEQGQLLTFSGVSALHPKLFAGYAKGRLALRPLFDNAIAQGKLTGQYHQGLWTDVGTPARLEELNQYLQVSH